jgi:hypothetical protein
MTSTVLLPREGDTRSAVWEVTWISARAGDKAPAPSVGARTNVERLAMSENSAATMPLPSVPRSRPISWDSEDRRARHAKLLYHAASSCCVVRALRLLASASLVFTVACRSPLSARKDAGTRADARVEDTLPDLPREAAAPPDIPQQDTAAPDLPAKDLGAPDLAKVTPKAFRFENHTDRTAYIQVDSPVGCRMQNASGWQACNYFDLGCLFHCDAVQVGEYCCVSCEQLLALYAIPPGASRSLPWNGNLHAKATGNCAACECQQATPVPSGDFEASARVYADYACMPSGCQTTSDGKLEMASPVGSYASIAVPFGVPYLAEEVVLDITWLPPTADAGTPPDTLTRDATPAGEPTADAPTSSDSALADMSSARDANSEPSRVTLADLAGRTYQIAAIDTLPDASLGGRACGVSNPGAVYNLVFSADGSTVSIVRVDGPQEMILKGSLMQPPASASRVDYNIDNAFAGGELSIRAEGSTFFALLVLYGSGVPVLWCIDSPMTPV